MKVKVWIQTSKLNSKVEKTIEVEDEALEGLSETEQDKVIEEVAQEELFSMYEWSWQRA